MAGFKGMGSKNIKNLDAMVAAGVITKAEADKIRRMAREKDKLKSLAK